MDIICLPGGLLGTNTYIVPIAGNRCFIVDPSAQLSAIKKNVTEGCVPSFAIFTHGHYDHMETLVPLKTEYPEIQICIHEADSWALGANSLSLHQNMMHEGGLDDLYSVFADKAGSKDLPGADVILKEGYVLETDWVIYHTPGHSPGSICLYNKRQKLLISGDTLFYMGWGRTDLSGGDEHKIMQSLKRLSDLPSDVKVFPGHGRYGFTMAQNPLM